MSQGDSFWCSRRVLVTGGSGVVGSHLVERLGGTIAWYLQRGCLGMSNR